MAERRMFAKTIVDSDAFLEMPATTQNLYFHLSMRADDDGFINSPKRISRMIGASDDDLRILAAKSFIIPFESGVVVIKHWRINNYLQSDRCKPTVYQEEKAMLEVKSNRAYTLKGSEVPCIQDVYSSYTQNSIDKNSIDKNSIGDTAEQKPQKRFMKPTHDDVSNYCMEKGITNVDPDRFIDYYESNGWKVGKNPMKDWKAAVRTWNKNGYGKTNTTTQKQGFTSYEGRDVDYTALERKLLGY